jgi:RNA polymerase sigma-70 factor, ECF subfamily
MEPSPDEYLPTHRSLLSRLRNWDDQESWKAFFNIYWKLIYSVARQSGLTDAEAQDTVQETIITVAKQIPQFHYDPALGSFKGWLLRITHRRICDQLRKREYECKGQKRPREEALDTALMDRQPDSSPIELERLWDAEWAKNLMETALGNVKRKTSPKDFQIFYLHVCQDIPARKLADRLDIKLAEVYFAKYKVARLLRKEIAHLETQIL